jgi:hypothetical protein
MQRRSLLLTLGGVLLARPAMALYDARPDPLLAQAAGAWKGTLSYRDYQPPHDMVTLQTRLAIAPTAPRQLALYYMFDDGPGKTVYSYEQMTFDFEAKTIAWNTGGNPPQRDNHAITRVETVGATTHIAFARTHEGKPQRHELALSPVAWSLVAYEPGADGVELLRSRYDFTRAGT